MKHLRLAFGYALCLAVFATAGCKPKPRYQTVGEPSSDQFASTTSAQQPTPSPSSSQLSLSERKAEQIQLFDLPKLANSVRPAVILVSVFDSSGKLLRTQTGFFISDDGKFITTAHAIEGGANGVAKTGDGGIFNVTGILASSSPLNLAILRADVKRVPFLALNENAKPAIGARVGVIGSGLAGSDGTPREGAISANNLILMESGLSSRRRCQAVRSVRRLSMKAGTAEARPTPRPTPKPRLVYAPAPSFPPEAYSRPGWRSGRFLLNFNTRGNVTKIQIIQSTGNVLFDRAASDTLRQWRSAPGREWVATVPITFQGR